MRLLQSNDGVEFSLTQDLHDDIPRYAILSHTWGADTEEVTFRDLTDGTSKDKEKGYNKIQFCEKQAREDGIKHFWVDTCCIDKSNHSELTEAINSMFRWYRHAAICYVYLSDVWTNIQDLTGPSSSSWHLAFRNSRWFRRGWTLQELIAPRSVVFFCANGNRLGDRGSLELLLHEITGIAVPALRGGNLSSFTFSERMSWAEGRDTKRPEDQAYSLLGILEVSMPLIYGEGVNAAFDRLKEELHKRELKRIFETLSAISLPSSNSAKRLKAQHSQSFSVPRCRDPNSLEAERTLYLEDPVHSIDATTKQSLIDKLYFPKIDERLTSLTAAQGTTCRWFLKKPEYTCWYNVAQQPDHCGFLWIKGNPGTGKSTLMKLLFETAKFNAKGNSLQLTLSFFFFARGSPEEKSTTGLYRSLLHQLFEKVVGLRDSLDWMTPDGARGIDRNGWHEVALKQTLIEAVKKLESQFLVIFVDALDECNKEEVADMVCFFEELCDSAREVQVLLRICFSSRHYPTISIQHGVEVTLEEEIGHEEDIKHYIKSKLRLGKSMQAESLRTEIFQRSSGIFLWVALVLEILNHEYPNSSISVSQIRKRLAEIPPELGELFEMILTRDDENPERLQLCLKWILFATRPLKPQELYFAIQLGLDDSCSSCWDQEDIHLDQMETYVRSSSKGLAEITRNKASEVQFIHESVRDYLLEKYENQWSGVSSNFMGCSHQILKDCCLAQLNASISQGIDLPDPLPQAPKAGQLRNAIELKFPFLRYSILNVLYHANKAQQKSIDQSDFLTKFPLQQWKSLKNALEKYDTRRYNDPVSMLYILAESNLADLIRIYSKKESCFDIGNQQHYGPPFFAALAVKGIGAADALLDIEPGFYHSVPPLVHDMCKKYCYNEMKWASLGRDFEFLLTRDALSYAAEYGDAELVSILLELGQCMPDDRNVNKQMALIWASQRRHIEVVKMLLEKGADVIASDGKRWTALHSASDSGHIEVVKMLLEKGADVKASNSGGWTALHAASRGGHVEVVKLLLEKGADVKASKNGGWTALHAASSSGHVEVVKMLLEKGADVKASDSGGWTALHSASNSGHIEVVKMLLEKGADITGFNKKRQTPLDLASLRGHTEIMKLLSNVG